MPFRGVIDHLDEALVLVAKIRKDLDPKNREQSNKLHNLELQIVEARRMLQRHREVTPT